MKYDKNKTKKKKCPDCKKMYNAEMYQVPNVNGNGYYTQWENQCRKCLIEFNRFMLSGLFKKTK